MKECEVSHGERVVGQYVSTIRESIERIYNS